MNQDDVRQLQKIESTFAELDRWREDAAELHFGPLSGSDLAADDQDWPWFPVSETARSGLAAAIDHLSAYRTFIEARNLYPWSLLTLVRAALVGGAQAVWVLAPDDPIERAGGAVSGLTVDGPE